MTRRFAALAGLCGVLLAPRIASAQGESLREQALAEIATGNFGEACPKLEAAYASDTATSTLLELAKCRDEEKKLAKAYAAYTRYLGLPAERTTDEGQKLARSRAAELGPRLSRVTVRVPAGLRSLPGLRVLVAGREIPHDEWDAPQPVDAGTIEVTAIVPGGGVRSRSVVVPVEGGDETVDLPDNPTAEKGAPKAVRVRLPYRRNEPDYAVDPSTFGPYQVAGVVTMTAGAVGTVAGILVGLVSAADYNRAALNCTNGLCNDRSHVEAGNTARETGDVGTVVGLSGLGVVAVGGALYFFGPKPLKQQSFSLITHQRLGVSF